jgi:hypothetical protein
MTHTNPADFTTLPPMHVERIDTCAGCGKELRVIMQNPGSPRESHKKASCSCGHEIVSQRCLSVLVEEVKRPPRFFFA